MASNGRKIAAAGARTVAGLAGIAIAIVVVGAATLLPLPSFSASPPSKTVNPVSAQQVRVCPGAALTLADGNDSANTASALGQAAELYGSSNSQVSTRRLVSGARTDSAAQAPLVVSVTTPQGSQNHPIMGAAQSQTVNSADTSGFTAAACTEPSSDAWLVGGSTALGHTTLVLLANPSAVDASVNLAVYTETGLVDSPGATDIDVPAGTQKVVPLAGLAPSADATIIHMTSTGGDVAAAVEQSYEQGIQPLGIDLLQPAAAPATQLRIPGVVFSTLAAVGAGQATDGGGSSFPVVRILVPGSADATLSVGVAPETGTSGGNAYAQRVKAGTVAEIPLKGLSDGTYTITIASNVPVVAAARSTVVGSQSTDFAWFAASSPMEDSQFVAVPAGPSPTLHLVNTGSKTAHAVLQTPGGTRQDVVVSGGAAIAVPLASGTAILSGVDGLYASVSYLGDGQIASFPLDPPGSLSSPITVYPH